MGRFYGQLSNGAQPLLVFRHQIIAEVVDVSVGGHQRKAEAVEGMQSLRPNYPMLQIRHQFG